MPNRTVMVVLFCFLISNSLFAKEPVVLTSLKVKELVLAENLQIKMAQLEKDQGHLDLPAAKSIYDTLLSSRVSYLKDKAQKSSAVFGTHNQTHHYDLSLSQKTPLGTEVGIGFLNQRDTTNSVFATVNPAYNSQIQTSLQQPVGQNTFGFVDRKTIQWVKTQIKALDYGTKAKMEALVYRVLVNYWVFYLTYWNEQFEHQAFQKAKELFLASKKKLEMGWLEKSDLYAFKANQDWRETLWLDSKNERVEAIEQLKMDLGSPLEMALKPGEEVFSNQKISSLDDLLRDAFSSRADYQAVSEEVKANALMVSLKKNSRLPQVDVLASLALNGIDDDYQTAVAAISDRHPAWLVGLEFDFPLQNRKSRSDYKKSLMDKAKKILELKEKELELSRQVATTSEEVKNSFLKMTAAQRMRESQSQKAFAEKQKYEQGRSSSDVVIRYENDTIDAKQLALKAKVDYRLSLLDLDFVRGKLLK